MVYHPEKVRAGIENDDLFDRLGELLARARAYFEERVDPEISRKTNVFDRAIVDVLVYRSQSLASRIW